MGPGEVTNEMLQGFYADKTTAAEAEKKSFQDMLNEKMKEASANMTLQRIYSGNSFGKTLWNNSAGDLKYEIVDSSDRLDKAEDQIAELRRERDMWHEKFRGVSQRVAYAKIDLEAWKNRAEIAEERLQSLDAMGSDLTKLERAIGKIRFKEILEAP
jgi:chromosome segregation ATPase